MFALKRALCCLLFNIWLQKAVFCASEDDVGKVTQHRYACVSPETCRTNIYSIECSVAEKIAVVGVSYGAKPYSSYCPNTQACVSVQQCCRYEPGDCLVPMNESELYEIYKGCSQAVQCGWLFASSTELTGDCRVRDRSNYIKADFKCISDLSLIDICSQHTVVGTSVHLHHSAIPPSVYSYNQCQCSISPEVCNTTATLKFRAVDVRLHGRDNLTSCDSNSRVELIGQREKKQYGCQSGKFLHGFEKFHTSSENNMMLYLHKRPREYPSKVWLEVQASLPDVKVRVTCGPRNGETTTWCPALPLSQSDTLDTVEDVPERKNSKPTVIHLDPEDLDPDLYPPEKEEPSEKQNTALAALIGGIVAGIVVLLLLLVVVGFILRKKRRNKKRKALPDAKECSPYADDTHTNNFYEPINDKTPVVSSEGGKHVIYHQPWGNQPGVRVQNRAKHDDLAYATSEEIRVLIEKMERDRKSIIDGTEDHYTEPDPTYYRHMSTFTFQQHSKDSPDGEAASEERNRKESETESVASENCGTEKLESEDSKVEADRVIDSDNESHKVESETVSAYYDGYESPRVSSIHPSDLSESVRTTSVRSGIKSNNPSELQNYVYHPDDVIFEDSQLDLDVPDEPAPPVSEALASQPKKAKNTNDLSREGEGSIRLTGYREPKGSNEILFADSDTDNETQSSHPYSPVYDEIKEHNTKF